MLGGPDWPPRNVTERSSTLPFPPSPLQLPDSSRVGGVTLNTKSTVTPSTPFPYKAFTSKLSPSRVPCKDRSAYIDTSLAPVRSSMGLVSFEAQLVKTTRLRTATPATLRSTFPVYDRTRTRMKLAIAILSLSVLAAAAEAPKIDVWKSGEDGYKVFRIPGIVVTAKGTVLAYAEARRSDRGDWNAIDIVLRRSTDGGR